MAGPLKAEELRDAKEFLVENIADQARQIGLMPAPDVHARAVDPIIRRVEVDAEDEARRGVRPDPPAPAVEEVERVDERGFEHFRGEAVGVAVIDPVTGEVELQMLGAPPPREPHWLRLRRARFRELRALPEWRARVEKVMHDPTLNADQRREKYESIYKDSVRLFGDPATRKDKRIQVGGGRR